MRNLTATNPKTARPAAPPAPLADLACAACGYNLRGLTPRGRCPECGTPITEAIAVARGDDVDPACLRALTGAAAPLLAAKVLWAFAAWAALAGSPVAVVYGTIAAATGPKLWQAMGFLDAMTRPSYAAPLALAAFSAHAAGAWWLVRPALSPWEPWRAARSGLRAAAALLVVSALALVTVVVPGAPRGGWLDAFAVAAVPVDAAVSALVWGYAAHVATRARERAAGAAHALRATFALAIGGDGLVVAGLLLAVAVGDTRTGTVLVLIGGAVALVGGTCAFYALARLLVRPTGR